MSQGVQCLLQHAKNIKFTPIGTKVTERDTSKIWDAVGGFVHYHLLQNKAVLIPGVGTFTLTQVKIPISHHPQKYLFCQRPMFWLSGTLSDRFGIRHINDYAEGFRPQVRLNLSMIALHCNMDRESADTCVKEVLLALHHCLRIRGAVDLPFKGVGTLKFRGVFVKMCFNKEFLDEIEETDVIKKVVPSVNA